VKAIDITDSNIIAITKHVFQPVYILYRIHYVPASLHICEQNSRSGSDIELRIASDMESKVA
jgi:hypothetical protein